jgi:hypothetical protein
MPLLVLDWALVRKYLALRILLQLAMEWQSLCFVSPWYMKAFIILGALVGFLIGTSSGLTGVSSWLTALWRGSAAALVAAIITRWWTGVWLECLRESPSQRRNARLARTPDLKSTAKT